MKSLLPEESIILTKNSDYFGYLEKIELIKNFIEGDETYFKINRMFALYGGWGSGKTSIIKTLVESDDEKYLIDKDKFKSFIFEAWKYEKDNNLAYSLFDFIHNKIFTRLSKEIMFENAKKAGNFLKSFVKNIQIELPGGFTIGGKDSFTESELSHYKQQEEFIELFQNMLKEENKKIIIFIDDLDRCDYENIINLLSAIKLFFTLSDRIIFFCALDKKAVQKALKYKYDDEEKADEYLEKIFTFSFDLPIITTEKLIKHYFGENSQEISNFLNKIGFKNPRHLKKILNKYYFIANLKKNNKYSSIIPDIIIDNTQENKTKTGNTIFTLYFLILKEFYYEDYLQLKDFEGRKEEYNQNVIINKTIEKKKLFLYEDDISYSKFSKFSLGIPINKIPEYNKDATNSLNNLQIMLLLGCKIKKDKELIIQLNKQENISYPSALILFSHIEETILLKFYLYINEISKRKDENNLTFQTDYMFPRFFELSELI